MAHWRDCRGVEKCLGMERLSERALFSSSFGRTPRTYDLPRFIAVSRTASAFNASKIQECTNLLTEHALGRKCPHVPNSSIRSLDKAITNLAPKGAASLAVQDVPVSDKQWPPKDREYGFRRVLTILGPWKSARQTRPVVICSAPHLGYHGPDWLARCSPHRAWARRGLGSVMAHEIFLETLYAGNESLEQVRGRRG